MNYLQSISLILSFLHYVDATIYESVSSSSRWIAIYDDTNTYTWLEAETYCQKVYSTSLASYHTATAELEVSQSRYDYSQDAWIGLTDQNSESGSGNGGVGDGWEWSDGSCYNFEINWYPGEPNDASGGEDYVHFSGSNSDYLNDLPATSELNSFICNYVRFTASKSGDYTGVYSNKGYLFNWEESETFCVDFFNSHLASTTSTTEESDASSCRLSATSDRAWVGLKNQVASIANAQWEWSDGTKYVESEVSWQAGQPDYDSEQCVHFWEDDVAVDKYNNWGCEELLIEFICNSASCNNSPTHEPTPDPTQVTAAPTQETKAPTPATAAPTQETKAPTPATAAPTQATASPTEETPAPTTREPTIDPTRSPTLSPKQETTLAPTVDPTSSPTIKYDCDGSTVDPEPLIYWNFDDVSGTVSRRGLNLFHNGAFDISMYDGEWRNPRDDPYDSTAGGPYLDGNGRLICQGDDTGAADTGANYIVLSDETIPFEVSGSKTYVVYGNTLNLNDIGGALMSIDSRFIQYDIEISNQYVDIDGVDIYIERQFDALVFNEFGAATGSAAWVAGSEGNIRSDLNAFSSFTESGAVYDSSTGEYNGIASFVLVYDEDEDTGEVYVTLYRNCERLGSYNSGNVDLFDVERNSGRFAFCQRHVDATYGTDSEFVIEYAAFYDYALSEDEVAGVCQCSNNGDNSVKTSKSSKNSNNNYVIGGLIGDNVDYVTVVAVIGIGLVFVMLVRIFMRKYMKSDKDGYIAIGEENGECSVKIDNYNSIV